jgi:hypothetical protein
VKEKVAEQEEGEDGGRDARGDIDADGGAED